MWKGVEMGASITFRWNKDKKTITEEATGRTNTRLFMVNEAYRLMDQLVPMESDFLAHNVDVYTEGDRGVVHYISPYATYVYRGTSLHFRTNQHQLATAYWGKAMMQVCRNDLTKAVQAYINRGGN